MAQNDSPATLQLTGPVDFRRGDFVARIRLNRPEKKNAINGEMISGLIKAFDECRVSKDVRVIVIEGVGDCFCAGADLADMQSISAPNASGDYGELLLRIANVGKPTIAKVRGYALGGGLGIAASCTFAYAAENAVLGTPEIQRGLFPMMIMAVLSRHVPERALMEMMLLGQKLTANSAMAHGLINAVLSEEKLDQRVDELARQLAAQSPTATRMGIAAHRKQRNMPFEEAIPYLRSQLYDLVGSEDAREGLQAFFQKRDPKWTG